MAHPRSENESFHLFFSEEIIRFIQRQTNRKASDLRRNAGRIYHYMNSFSFEEIEACFGILIYAGADRDNFTDIRDLWDPIEGKPLYKATMSINRFQFLLQALRFDNFLDRLVRQQNDRLAAIREI